MTGPTTGPTGAVVAVAAAAGSARSLVPLLALVGEGHHIVSWHQSVGGPVDVVVASGPDLLDAVVALTRTDGAAPAVACRVASEADLDAARDLGVAVTFTSRPELAAASRADGSPVALAPDDGLDLARHAVLPPLTRSRIRQALDLPDRLVLAVDRTAPEPDRTTGLALASAAVVDGDLLPLALALGTPTVTDPASAARFGLTDGLDVVVAPTPAEADALAAALARDEARCAALSRNARAFAERRLDLGTTARHLRRSLGLDPEPALIDLRLDELHTPPSSRLWVRAHDALSPFTMESTR